MQSIVNECLKKGILGKYKHDNKHSHCVCLQRNAHPICLLTYPEVIVDIARENGGVVVWSEEVGWRVHWFLSKFILEPLLVADIHLPALGLQEVDEGLDHPQRSISERHQDQNLYTDA